MFIVALTGLAGLIAATGVGCEGAAREVGGAVEASLENTAAALADRADPEQIERLRRLEYPAASPVGEDLDIVVTRRGGRINLANRTPRDFENVVLWLNRQYVSPVDRIVIGPRNELVLRSFINRYGESFPVGGLLSPDKGFPVVLAEIHDLDTNQRHRLTVWP